MNIAKIVETAILASLLTLSLGLTTGTHFAQERPHLVNFTTNTYNV